MGDRIVIMRHGRIVQSDLQPDDRMDPRGLRGSHEADGAVQTGVVRDRQPGQPEGDGPLGQVVGRRGAVKEREIRVAMQFGVRDRGHGIRSGRGPAGRGPVSIEQMF